MTPVLAGLAAVIQDDFLAGPAKPAGQGKSRQLVVRQDCPASGLGRQKQSDGRFFMRRRALRLVAQSRAASAPARAPLTSVAA